MTIVTEIIKTGDWAWALGIGHWLILPHSPTPHSSLSTQHSAL
ncbi:hypothetical protein [Nostoc sp.]